LMNGALRRKCQGAVAGSQSIVFSPDRRTIIDTSGTGFVRIWDAETGRIRLQFKGCKNANHMFSAALSTDGKVVATSGPDEFVRLWHAATGEQLGQFEGH